jgi:hypothetical protein
MRHGMSSRRTAVRTIPASVAEQQLLDLQRVTKMILSEAW